jgi:hypothetical membrane protein
MKKIFNLRLLVALLCIYLPQCWVFVTAAGKNDGSSIWIWVKMFLVLPGVPAAFLLPHPESSFFWWYATAGIVTLLAIIVTLRTGYPSKGIFAVMAVLLALTSTWMAFVNYALYAA